ncbi:hypothetical protein F4778DRAFT_751868 [Xylariomycetidae sp. FL2044]|nr:hypothetical protein F4778DRAFT_751868 [Xylariomycetidae sp. FL2044]
MMSSFGKLIAVTIAVLGYGQVATAQDFVQNCTWETGLLADNYLGMYCNNDDWAHYSYDWTWLNTALCLSNNGGALLATDSGNYFNTCLNCTVRGSNVDFLLNCNCLSPDGRVREASFDLNRIVFNQNGTLGCYDHLGNKTERGPF